ncbi:MAG: uroporphyrinogen-III synthase [Devosiaceae bacterium]|nr:uroporphyrinogen-III synthase [Devosiaceae bacterium MH13]
MERAEKPAVLITRAEPFASETAQRVKALGYTPVVMPLTAIVPLEEGVRGLRNTLANSQPVRAVIVTSAAVPHVLLAGTIYSDAYLNGLRTSRFFVVGNRSADLLREAGLTVEEPPAGDVAELIDMLRHSGSFARSPQPPLYLCGRDRRPVLEDAFAQIVPIEVYEARALAPSADKQDLMPVGSADLAVLAYSARSANLIASALKSAFKDNHLPNLVWVCLSAQVADAVRTSWSEDASVHVSEKPNEIALLATLQAATEAANP